MQATQSLPPGLVRQFEKQERERLDAERADAIREIAKLNSEFLAKIKPFDDAVADARAAVEAAEEKLRETKANESAAHAKRSAFSYPHNRKLDLLRSRLADDLQHPAIATALEQIAEIADEARASNPAEADAIRAVTKTLDWCRSSREAILNLQFSDAEPADAVRKIMSSRPH